MPAAIRTLLSMLWAITNLLWGNAVSLATVCIHVYLPPLALPDPLAHSWEKEFLSVRLTEKLFQQSRVIAEVRNGIDAFDNEIIELQKARLDVDLKTKFLEAHFLMLYQELWILKDFEQVESEMLEKIASDLGKCEDIKLEYLCEKAKVEASLGYIKEFKEEIHDMRSLLERECAGSKHENYLMSIFRENSGICSLHAFTVFPVFTTILYRCSATTVHG